MARPEVREFRRGLEADCEKHTSRLANWAVGFAVLACIAAYWGQYPWARMGAVLMAIQSASSLAGWQILKAVEKMLPLLELMED